MNRARFVLAALGVLGALALAPALPAQDAPPVDATLESMSGGERSLAAERGRRAVILFYEDRDHLEDNDALKGEVARFIVDNHLDDRAVAYGVANLLEVGAVPHAIVRQMISPLVERWGSDILLDWDGVLRRAPFSLATAASNVVIVDRTGHIAYRYVGPLDADQRRAFYRSLRGAVMARPTP